MIDDKKIPNIIMSVNDPCGGGSQDISSAALHLESF